MSDFYVKLNGEVINLSPGTSITLERYNALFDFDELRGSAILDYTVPFSAKTDRVFNWYGLHKTALPNKKILAEKYAQGSLIERGFVELADVTEAGYVLLYGAAYGSFFKEYQSLKLNEIDFGTSPINFKESFDYLSDHVFYPLVNNPVFYGDAPPAGFNDLINEVGNANSPKVPMPSLKFVFDSLETLCNVKFEGDFFDTEWFKRGVLDNTFSLDGLTEITYRNHLPDLTIPEFLKHLGKLLNIAIFISPTFRKIKMVMRDALMQQDAVMDISSKIVPSRSRTPEKASRLELKWMLDGDDGLTKTLPDALQDYRKTGNEDETFFTIETAFSTRLMDGAVPIAEQEGISIAQGKADKKFSPKLLLYNSTGVAKSSYAGYSLKPADLAVSNFSVLEKWRERTSSREVFAKLSAADLAKLNYAETGGQNSKVHIHGRNYFIENIRVNLPLEGYATMKVWEW